MAGPTEPLKALVFDQFDADDALRRRLARFLHDEIAQSLAILKLELSVPDGAGTDAEKAGRMLELIDGALARSRDFSAEIRPPLLDHLGLAAAVGSLLRRSDPAGTIKLDIQPALPQLRPEMNWNCYRICELVIRRVLRDGPGPEALIAMRRDQGFTLTFEAPSSAFSDDWENSPDLLEIHLRAARIRCYVESFVRPDARTALSVVFAPSE